MRGSRLIFLVVVIVCLSGSPASDTGLRRGWRLDDVEHNARSARLS